MNTEELREKIQQLKAENNFSAARGALQAAIAAHGEGQTWFHQELALCTYKDADLHPDYRFEEAMKILRKIHLQDPDQVEPETLSLAGAVMKRKWEFQGGLENLLESLHYYRSAFRANPEKDRGYGGVNAAYLLDVLAIRFKANPRSERDSPIEDMDFHGQAVSLRKDVVTLLEPLSHGDQGLQHDYWHLATLAEAHYGLRDYLKARDYLKQAVETRPGSWQLQSTFHQLVGLAKLQNVPPPQWNEETATYHAAWQSLVPLVGKALRRAIDSYPGKVGLALSGGGFRASFYHIGVLARLADVDLLREVEVLSTVSGGSIIGTHYYLELQKLLETKPDKQISRNDYLGIVQRLQREFLDGVQNNLRTQSMASWRHAFRLAFSSSYSHTHRMGELYEDHLYSRVADGKEKIPRKTSDLVVKPVDEPEPSRFRPKYHNWLRGNKVPILLLNTTSLNSGHSWHFTAKWMGEPPQFVGREIDINERYSRLNYSQAPWKTLQDFRLGYAVAASACVPALFPPLTIAPLFPDRVVRLVDGGVFDNQGIKGLLDEACSLILCSDASGQMNDQQNPSGGVLAVPLRSNQILSNRVREAQYQELKARVETGALDGLLFVHLKHGLSGKQVELQQGKDKEQAEPESSITDFGMDKTIQRLLSEVRTDLDSFTEVEAYALMLSGYLMTEQQLKELASREYDQEKSMVWARFDVQAPRGEWDFLKLEPIARDPAAYGAAGLELKRLLRTASMRVFKASANVPGLKRIGMAALVVGAGVVAWLGYRFWASSWTLVLPIVPLVAILILLAGVVIHQVLAFVAPGQYRDSIFIKAILVFVGTIMAKLHLRFIDPIFLKQGRLERLMSLIPENRGKHPDESAKH